ncbi:DUF1127 domain-containing protein [Nereida sp. MMG025]|uniref:DUF1127 domain-containing protein n=1 Tax=Nereida sp. MMG025 TaxID=2909981 RepID=UPI001F4796F7|nr:DUF1127 domain-containing protein [Nereida sp. MMG025]MCF6445219.1 DUF1127 domain-containing protein [Nereida sp. MMG025]
MAHTNTNTQGYSPLVDFLRDAKQTLTTRYTKYRLYRNTLNELGMLSSADLADLGLNRGMIKSVAFEAAYGK